MDIIQKNKLIINRMKDKINSNSNILFTGAGSGISAKFQEKGGSDGIIALSSGKFRIAGQPSLSAIMPYENSNRIVKSLCKEINNVVYKTPIFAGLCCTDPTINKEIYLKKLIDLGVCGINNFPSVGMISGRIRENLEEVGISFEAEAKFMSLAMDMGLITAPYVFSIDEAIKMAKIGVDIIIIHLGSTVGGSIGVKTAITIDNAIKTVMSITRKILDIDSEIIVLFQGGPIESAKEASIILDKSSLPNGICVASVGERLPIESSIFNSINELKNKILIKTKDSQNEK